MCSICRRDISQASKAGKEQLGLLICQRRRYIGWRLGLSTTMPTHTTVAGYSCRHVFRHVRIKQHHWPNLEVTSFASQFTSVFFFLTHVN
mmetsp:Transcript_92732/g.170140  ORF Transcript_92732/g.170140 Transcript_92732/m.170140 type:complete len:90 (+) Transcript_92732:1734-2003(+)